MTTKIYWTSIEYRYDVKSLESKKLKGGFVYAFIKAKDSIQTPVEISFEEVRKM